MFNSQKKTYKVYKPNKTTDNYNQGIINWEDAGTVDAFIALNSHMVTGTNAVYAQQCEYIGITSLSSSSQNLEIGYRIDKYEIVFIVDAGRERFLYLKEYGR